MNAIRKAFRAEPVFTDQVMMKLVPFYGSAPLYDVENMEATGLHRESGGSGSEP